MESVESKFWCRRGFSTAQGADVLLRPGFIPCLSLSKPTRPPPKTVCRTKQYMCYDYADQVFLYLPEVVSAECTGPTEGQC